jgi:hypothetical protein
MTEPATRHCEAEGRVNPGCRFRHCEHSEAIQAVGIQRWIAASQPKGLAAKGALLAMTISTA